MMRNAVRSQSRHTTIQHTEMCGSAPRAASAGHLAQLARRAGWLAGAVISLALGCTANIGGSGEGDNADPSSGGTVGVGGSATTGVGGTTSTTGVGGTTNTTGVGGTTNTTGVGGTTNTTGVGGTTPTGSGGSATGTGGTGPGPCDYPMWQQGTNYVAGDIVTYTDGNLYVAVNDNPGYDPIESDWYWDPYTCDPNGTGGSGGSGGSGGTSGGISGFSEIVTKQLFDQMFPSPPRNGFYTYEDLVAATHTYPNFASSSDINVAKREAAAFLANVAHETGDLQYIEQIAKDVYCSHRDNCPCAAGKQYFGRGPIQISWNYNYCAAGNALGVDIRSNPDLVAQDAEIAWGTGLWFWMTQSGAGSMTPHNAIVNGHGFGETVRSINGGVECDGKRADLVQMRIDNYNYFCSLLGVDPGSNLTC